MTHDTLSIQQRRVARWQAVGMLPRLALLSLDIDSNCDELEVRSALESAISALEGLRTRYRCVVGMRTEVPEVQDVSEPGLLEWSHSAPCAANAQNTDVPWVVYAHWQPLGEALSGDNRLTLYVDPKSIDVRSAELLCQLLNGQLQGLPAAGEALDYSVVAEWQASLLEDEDSAVEREEANRFWQRRLGALSALRLPTSRFRETLSPIETLDSTTRTRYRFELSARISETMLALVEEHNDVALGSLLQACWAACIAERASVRDLTVSSYVAEQSIEELQDCFGLLDGFLPMALVLDDSHNWFELAGQIHQQVQSGLENIEFYRPEFPDSVDNSATSETSTTAQGTPAGVHTTAAFQFVDWNLSAGPFLQIREFDHQADWHVLQLSVKQQVGDALVCELLADDDLLSKGELAGLAGQWQALLAVWLRDPSQTLRTALAASLVDRPARVGSEDVNAIASPLAAVAQQMIERPAAPAFRFCDDCLSYGQLRHACFNIVSVLQHETARGDRVGLMMDRRIELLPALLGVMWSGRVAVPLDPASPRSRLRHILDDSQCRCVLVDSGNAHLLEDTGTPGITLPQCDAHELHSSESAAEILFDPPAAAQPAYILYTSGTTGTPRGVCVSHGALGNYTRAMADVLAAEAGSQFGWISTYAADLGYTAVFPALIRGGCVHLIAAEHTMDVSALNAYCEQFPLDVLKIVPSHCLALLQASEQQRVSPEFLPTRTLVLGGEHPGMQLLQRLLIDRSRPARVINHYGPTEATVGVMWSELSVNQPHGLQNVLANNRVCIVNESLRCVPPGCRGELAIIGANLSEGYWRDAAATENRFVDFPGPDGKTVRGYLTGDYAVQSGDGRVHILGRSDDQLKIRGYRVEPAEVERAILTLPRVSEAVVVRHRSQADQLAAYIVPVRNESPDIADMRTALSRSLPDYMVPVAWVTLDHLPLTQNGKIDRAQLPNPDISQTRVHVPPQSDAERLMLAIWQDTLELAQIGTADNFFDVGGHSLLAIKLLSQVRTQFRVEVGPGAMVEAATPAELVQHLIALEAQPGLIEKVAAARIRLAQMDESERSALSERAMATETHDGDHSHAARRAG
ncbi:MAG: AMP-binding protein [Pseudomonadota bacterium]